jgi:tRNA G18 (ribose-2'-O)-methylase SpoU
MEHIQSLDDPRVAAYRNLPDRTLRGESIFLAEGRLLAERLLASRYEVESVFVSTDYYEDFRRLTPAGVPLYVAEEALLLEIVGFPFHRGALAVGRRGRPTTFEELLAPAEDARQFRLAICPEITKPENMGLIFRNAAAFGLGGILLGERCCDPFSRRAMRVSMGATLRVPFCKTESLRESLQTLTLRREFPLYAAVLDPAAKTIGDVSWPSHCGILLGNEMDGLDTSILEWCDHRVTIPITDRVDSLNLGVASGIFMFAMQSNLSSSVLDDRDGKMDKRHNL